ncbi:hypothetical protein EV193_102643 [Herbihabitans rhizosphaerae]|uniref:Uncharacterized protein n=1 Tax=Herbihabitans rhizosphaerae TaxID=1872711 RepID=A0A4Q7L5W0_9PSEU|nr:hypothetical protein [Herbihabitans rhizosphaerae]RZS43662.1 hypothetical protein EV193_102643 [Herbihabitans rhizosphaerae]
MTSIVEYLRRGFADTGYPDAEVREPSCAGCGGRRFSVEVDDEDGCARRVCVSCDRPAFIADSEEHWADADPGECECPCGAGVFEVAVGYALRQDGEVGWIAVGLRCVADGNVGVYTDWKIDYEPSRDLLAKA